MGDKINSNKTKIIGLKSFNKVIDNINRQASVRSGQMVTNIVNESERIDKFQ